MWAYVGDLTDFASLSPSRRTKLLRFGRLFYLSKIRSMGWGGSQVVTLLAFYPVDPSSNPTEVYNFSCGYTKRGRGWTKKNWSTICWLFLSNWSFFFIITSLRLKCLKKCLFRWQRRFVCRQQWDLMTKLFFNFAQ